MLVDLVVTLARLPKVSGQWRLKKLSEVENTSQPPGWEVEGFIMHNTGRVRHTLQERVMPPWETMEHAHSTPKNPKLVKSVVRAHHRRWVEHAIDLRELRFHQIRQ